MSAGDPPKPPRKAETRVVRAGQDKKRNAGIVNTRAGFQKEGLRIEGFIRNLLDDDSWTACARWTDFDHPPNLAQLTVYQGVAVTQNSKRQVGIRASLEF